MLKKYVIRNFYDNVIIGEMLYDRDINKGTIRIDDMEHSCFYLQVKYPSGRLNEEETDALIKYRVEPPERQLISYYMNAATGKTGSAYNPYTLFFWHKGRHVSDYLEFIEEE